MSANIFIDTNIFLSFYHISNENLNELAKLADSLNEGEVVLFLPDQVIDEFWRNRESKVADAMNAFRKHSFKVSFPQICIGYPEYQEIQCLIRKCSDAKTSLVNAIEKDFLNQELRADYVIEKIFDAAHKVETTPPLLERARNRMELGKPPGKSGSLGDAINWEALLSEVPDSEPLHIISRDGDFSSRLDGERIDPYLAREWNDSMSSEVHYYKTLTGLFKKIDVAIQLLVDRSRSECIEDLENSRSYQSTHLAIAKLTEFESEFSIEQLNRLLCVLQQNDQVGDILLDEDVRDFYAGLIDGRLEDIYRETLEILKPRLMRLERVIENTWWDEEVAILLQRFAPLISLDPSTARSIGEDTPF